MTENQHGDGTAYHLGIDLGTTYVAAGILEQGRPEIITLGDRAPVLPSVLYFREDGEVLTGESASRRGLSDPTRVVREFKRRVGDTTPLVVGQTPYSVDVLMAKLVRFVHDAVVERQGAAPQVVAVTHPANWGPYKIDVLEQAVRIAGIGEVTTITEPVAAAIHYAAAERLDPGETVAVYDLGGGTFDAAVLRKTDHDFEVLGEVEGIERLGGIDFDEAVFQHVVRFCEPSLAELDVDDPAVIQALARLRQECVEAKEVLSTDTEVTIPVALPNLQTEVRLTRAEFEAMIRPLLRQTVDALRRAIGSADVEPAELSAVLLVGGCSRIPLISEMVGSELGRPIAVDRHPKHTVALGAAIAAGRSAQAPEPHVDDWFRTDPTSQDEVRSEPAAGPRGGVAAAAGAAAADLFSMFPLEEGAAGAEADPGGAGDRANPSPAAAEALRSPAERLGTTPVALAIPAASLLTAAVPANSKPAAAVPANVETGRRSSDHGRRRSERACALVLQHRHRHGSGGRGRRSRLPGPPARPAGPIVETRRAAADAGHPGLGGVLGPRRHRPGAHPRRSGDLDLPGNRRRGRPGRRCRAGRLHNGTLRAEHRAGLGSGSEPWQRQERAGRGSGHRAEPDRNHRRPDRNHRRPDDHHRPRDHDDRPADHVLHGPADNRNTPHHDVDHRMADDNDSQHDDEYDQHDDEYHLGPVDHHHDEGEHDQHDRCDFHPRVDGGRRIDGARIDDRPIGDNRRGDLAPDRRRSSMAAGPQLLDPVTNS